MYQYFSKGNTPMFSSRLIRSALLTLLICGSSLHGADSTLAATLAQPAKGYSISGQVTNTDGSVMPGLTVTARFMPRMRQQREAIAPRFRTFSIWGQARVTVVDGAGQLAGLGTDGVVVNDLPTVDYFLNDGGVVFSLPTETSYQIIIHHLDGQPLQIIAADYAPASQDDTQSTLQAVGRFGNISAPTNSVTTIATANAPIAQLLATTETNVDGTPETVVDTIVVVEQSADLADTAMPTTSLTLAGVQDAQGLYTTPVLVTASAQDTGIGVLASYLSLDEGRTWQLYTAPVTIEPGSAFSVLVYSVDRVGNQEYPPQRRAFDFDGLTRLHLPVLLQDTNSLQAEQGMPLLDTLESTLEPQSTETEMLSSARLFTTTTDNNGNYRFSGLRAGTYRVVVRHPLGEHLNAGRTVEVPPSQTRANFRVPVWDRVPEIRIGAGPFDMGCHPRNQYDYCGFDETFHRVNLDTYYIDQYEVTNARYKACVDAGKCTPPASSQSRHRVNYYPWHSNYPVINVTWHQAAAFCTWASKRLPTEAEWERAASSFSYGVKNKYVWGNNWQRLNANTSGCLNPTPATARQCALAVEAAAAQNCSNVYHQWTQPWWDIPGITYGARSCGSLWPHSLLGDGKDTIPVGSVGGDRSYSGVRDMAGNVQEWVNDWYHGNYYYESPSLNPQGPTTGTHRVIRGGSILSSDSGYGDMRDMRVATRFSARPDVVGYIGFRCARSQ